MKKMIVGGLAAGVVGLGLAVAGPANASADQFTLRTHQEMPYVVAQYGDAALLNEGYKVCHWEAQGTTGASDLADLIVADMPMSRSAAIQLQVLAEFHLGC